MRIPRESLPEPARPPGFAGNGRRTPDWWALAADAGLAWPGREREQSTLYEAGCLGDDEAAALVAYWREQFERAHSAGFAFCMGVTGWLTGAAARQAHLAWADVPESLVTKWEENVVAGF